MSGVGDIRRGDDAARNGVDAAERESAVHVEIRRGDPTPEELAAVVAVVTEAYARESAAAIAEDDRRRSAWEVTARGLRDPLRRDIGWGRFGS